jgi:hypothetical protein
VSGCFRPDAKGALVCANPLDWDKVRIVAIEHTLLIIGVVSREDWSSVVATIL